MDETESILLAAALGSPDPNQHPTPLQRGRLCVRAQLRQDQCAYCKEVGHWKNECPRHGEAKNPPKRKPLASEGKYRPKPPLSTLIGLAGLDSD